MVILYASSLEACGAYSLALEAHRCSIPFVCTTGFPRETWHQRLNSLYYDYDDDDDEMDRRMVQPDYHYAIPSVVTREQKDMAPGKAECHVVDMWPSQPYWM
jgi:hypothetical protein